MLRDFIFVVAGGALLASCANPNVDLARQAQTGLVGLPKADLYSCAGVPDRADSIEGFEYATYVSKRSRAGSSTSFGFGYGRRHGHFGSSIGLGFPLYGSAENYSCKATFTLQDGKVSRIVYGSDESSGDFRLSQCYRIVENCL